MTTSREVQTIETRLISTPPHGRESSNPRSVSFAPSYVLATSSDSLTSFAFLRPAVMLPSLFQLSKPRRTKQRRSVSSSTESFVSST